MGRSFGNTVGISFIPFFFFLSPSAGLKTEPGILVLKENGFSEIMLEGMHFNVIDLIRSSSTAAHWSI